MRKIITLTSRLCQNYKLLGWRQAAHNIKKIKSICTIINKIRKAKPRKTDKIDQKTKNLKKAYRKLIKTSIQFIDRAVVSINILKSIYPSENFKSIEEFMKYAKILINQIERRIFQNEQIPHDEKIFSVFEPHTEWICKGKAKAPFELGKRVSILEDQYGFILNATIMDRLTDDKIAVSIIQTAKKDFDNISTCSFDKGYYSKENKEKLSKLLDFLVLPKKGRLSKKDIKEQSIKEYKKYRKRHPSIESAIHALEVHGLDRCLDKGIKGFERYVAMAIASRNTQIIGGFKLSRLKKKFKIAA